jgi:hypothetical protein
MSWTSYKNASDLRDNLDEFISELKAMDMTCLGILQILFAPTGTLQEHSLSNGWENDYLDLSKKFDLICSSMDLRGLRG